MSETTSTPLLTRRFNYSYGLGLVSAVPLSYPSPPYYLAGLFAITCGSLLLLFRNFDKKLKSIVLLSLLLIGISFLSSALSPFPELIGWTRALSTSLFYSVFLIGVAISNQDDFFLGFVDALLVQSLVVIGASTYLFSWGMGGLNWSIPELRLWGSGVFPDWPNFYAILICIAALMAFLHQRRNVAGLICIAAAILTTSRLAFLCILVLVVWTVFFDKRVSSNHRVAIVAASLVGMILTSIVVFTSSYGAELISRLLLVSDRVTIFESAARSIEANPTIGIGGVLFDSSTGNAGAASFHNSYLEVLVRNGIIGAAIYVSLISIPLFKLRFSDGIFPVVIFIMASSLVQNSLRHPSVALFYSVVIAYALLSGARPSTTNKPFKLDLPQA